MGGKVSGGLLIIDFDEARFYDAWREQVGSLADGLPVQRTGRDGGETNFSTVAALAGSVWYGFHVARPSSPVGNSSGSGRFVLSEHGTRDKPPAK